MENVEVKRQVGRPKSAKTIEKEKKIEKLKTDYFNIKKSDKMAPKAKSMTMDEKLDKLLESVAAMSNRLNSLEKMEVILKKQVENEVKSAEKKIKEHVLEEVKKHIDKKLVEEKESEVNVNQEAVNEVRQIHKEIMKEKEDREKAEKRNNLVITGRNFDKNNLKEEVNKWIFNILRIRVVVLGAWKIKEEVIGIRLETFSDKLLILKNKSLLKETKIFINDDLTFNEREVQRKIKEIALQYKQKDENVYVSVRYRKLIVGELVYVWSEKEENLVLNEKEKDQNSNKENK